LAYSLPFLVPSSDVMEAFAKLSDEFGTAAERSRNECNVLAGIRDLLLPQLVTGQIDVSHLDLDAVLETAG